MPYLKSKVPEVLSNKNITLEKLYRAYLDLTDYTALQRRELDYLLTHLNGDNVQNVLDIINRKGINPAFVKWFKNMCWNSSFEVRYSDGTAFCWNGGTTSNSSNFYGTYSLLLTPGETSVQTEPSGYSALVNPQWYASFKDAKGNAVTRTRVSFHKKGGAVNLYVLDGDNADAAFTLTRVVDVKDTGEEITESGSYLTYANTSNWESEAFTVYFTHGTSTEIKVKFENADAADNAYIDAVIIEPDYTWQWPSSYTDGPYSAATSSGLVLGEQTDTAIYRASNSAEVTVDTSEDSIATKTLTLSVASDIYVSFSSSFACSDALVLTLKTYLTEPGGVAAVQTYQPIHTIQLGYANDGTGYNYTFTYSDVFENIAVGEVTIEVKGITDESSCTIAAGFGVLSIITVPTRELLIAPVIMAGYVFGGASGASYLLDCDEYIPDTWASKTDMPVPARGRNAASTILGKCYTYAGYAATRINDCDEYDPSGNSWANKTTLPNPVRFQLSACTISDKGYVFGGFETLFLQDCDEYTSDTWTNKTDMPVPARYWFAAAAI